MPSIGTDVPLVSGSQEEVEYFCLPPNKAIPVHNDGLSTRVSILLPIDSLEGTLTVALGSDGPEMERELSAGSSMLHSPSLPLPYPGVS